MFKASGNMALIMNKTSELLKIIRLIILENRGEISRAEDSLERVLASLNIYNYDVFAIPTAIFINYYDGVEEHSIVKRVKKRGSNLGAIDKVNNVCRDLVNNKISIDDALLILKTTDENKTMLKSTFYATMCVAFFSILFGGD